MEWGDCLLEYVDYSRISQSKGEEHTYISCREFTAQASLLYLLSQTPLSMSRSSFPVMSVHPSALLWSWAKGRAAVLRFKVIMGYLVERSSRIWATVYRKDLWVQREISRDKYILTDRLILLTT